MVAERRAPTDEWDKQDADKTPERDVTLLRAVRLPTVEILRPVVRRAAGFVLVAIGGWAAFLGFLWWLSR